MIDYASACKTAYEFYKEAWHTSGLCDAKDLGGSHITVSKTDGSVEQFVLPDEGNFKLLKTAASVEIPAEFKD